MLRLMPTKGFAILPIIIVFVIVAGLCGAFYLYSTHKASQSQNGNQTESASSDNVEELSKKAFFQNNKSGDESCPSKSPDGLFTKAITNKEDIQKITPGGQTGDGRFTYLWINGQKSVPVYAPAAGVLSNIYYKTRTDLGPEMSQPDYDLLFKVDCHTMYRINHITNPIDEIANTRKNSEAFQITPGHPQNESDTIPKSTVKVSAGEQIGTTTGTPAAHNFDFGVFVDSAAVCPYDKFREPLKSSWLALFGSSKCEVSGNY